MKVLTKISNKSSISLETQLKEAVSTGENGMKLARTASKDMQKRTKKEMDRQYNALLNRIGDVLSSPSSYGLGGTAGGSKTIKLRDGRGQFLIATTPMYPGLSLDYQLRGKKYGLVSTQFWNKSKGNIPREVGLGNRSVSLSNAYKAAVSGRHSTKLEKNKIREHRHGKKSNYTQRLRFRFSPLPSPLDEIILRSFITGELHTPPVAGHNYNRNSVGVVSYPEHFRPLLSVISVSFSNRTMQGLNLAVKGRTRK